MKTTDKYHYLHLLQITARNIQYLNKQLSEMLDFEDRFRNITGGSMSWQNEDIIRQLINDIETLRDLARIHGIEFTEEFEGLSEVVNYE